VFSIDPETDLTRSNGEALKGGPLSLKLTSPPGPLSLKLTSPPGPLSNLERGRWLLDDPARRRRAGLVETVAIHDKAPCRGATFPGRGN